MFVSFKIFRKEQKLRNFIHFYANRFFFQLALVSNLHVYETKWIKTAMQKEKETEIPHNFYVFIPSFSNVLRYECYVYIHYPVSTFVQLSTLFSIYRKRRSVGFGFVCLFLSVFFENVHRTLARVACVSFVRHCCGGSGADSKIINYL